MNRISIENVLPGMILTRNVYDEAGKVMITANMELSERIIGHLRSRNISDIYVQRPDAELPALSTEDREQAIGETCAMVEQVFDTIREAGSVLLSSAEDQLIHDVVNSVLENPAAVVHTARIQRHSSDLMSHSLHVSLLAVVTAAGMGITDRTTLYETAVSALLHDIGQIMIPAVLIRCNDDLSLQEQVLYQEHTNWGYTILSKSSDLPATVARVALEHHEHVDGSGYPNKLLQDAMLPVSRIIAVVNAYERIVSSVPCQNSNNYHRAYETVLSEAGTFYDLDAARCLLSQVPIYQNGTVVELTNGLTGKVTASKKDHQHRPVVEISTHQSLDLSSQACQDILINNIVG